MCDWKSTCKKSPTFKAIADVSLRDPVILLGIPLRTYRTNDTEDYTKELRRSCPDNANR